MMKDAKYGSGLVVVPSQESSRKPKKRINEHCSICTQHIWFDGVSFIEPDDVPEPRRSWTLCKSCYGALLIEMRRSPIRSSLRLRVAMGIVAAERWPQGYSRRARGLLSDRRWVMVMAWGFVIAMLFHLMLIVMLAFIAR